MSSEEQHNQVRQVVDSLHTIAFAGMLAGELPGVGIEIDARSGIKNHAAAEGYDAE